MIDYIKGEIQTLTPASVVIEVQGIGYFISISLNTFSDIQSSTKAKLFIYEAIREDAIQLFGFARQEERAVFMELIGVSGIGANTARMILSSFTVEEIWQNISNENVNAIKSVKGIGLKTAQRIIIDLKDKSVKIAHPSETGTRSEGSEQVRYEAVAALQMLGFAATASQKVINQILSENPGMPVEKVIKAALKML